MSHRYDSIPKKSRRKRDSNPGSSALEADALTTRPTRRSRGREHELADRLTSTTDITAGLQHGKVKLHRGLRNFPNTDSVVEIVYIE